jgi:hypothetical protein
MMHLGGEKDTRNGLAGEREIGHHACVAEMK